MGLTEEERNPWNLKHTSEGDWPAEQQHPVAHLVEDLVFISDLYFPIFKNDFRLDCEKSVSLIAPEFGNVISNPKLLPLFQI